MAAAALRELAAQYERLAARAGHHQRWASVATALREAIASHERLTAKLDATGSSLAAALAREAVLTERLDAAQASAAEQERLAGIATHEAEAMRRTIADAREAVAGSLSGALVRVARSDGVAAATRRLGARK